MGVSTATKRACGRASASGNALSCQPGTRKYSSGRGGKRSRWAFAASLVEEVGVNCLCCTQLAHRCCVVGGKECTSTFAARLLLPTTPTSTPNYRISCNQRESAGRASVQRNLELAVNLSRNWPASTGIDVSKAAGAGDVGGAKSLPPGPAEITPCDVFKLIRGRTLWIIG